MSAASSTFRRRTGLFRSGEPFIWIAGTGLAAAVLMVAGLLALVLANGLGFFWPADLHAWTLTSDMEVVSAHLMVTAGTDAHGVLDQARSVLRDRYGIDHATLQVEPDDHQGCEDVNW